MKIKLKWIIKMCYFSLFVLFVIRASGAAWAAFVPTDPILPLNQVRPGMKGEARTVISGNTIVSFPVKVLGILPTREAPYNLIVIRAEGELIEKMGIAQGMSGSPVYINGKLVGAIGYGWPFSDSRLGMLTPIEAMISIFDWKDRLPSFAPPLLIPDTPLSPDEPKKKSPDISPDVQNIQELSADTLVALSQAPLVPLLPPLTVSGISKRMMQEMSRAMGRPVLQGGGSGIGKHVAPSPQLRPGSAIGVTTVWGDILLGGIGTLTAVGKDGRFIGFAHPFLRRGATAIPVTDATIIHVIPSVESPFKLGYFGKIRGIITQDRSAAIGGRLGLLAPAISCTLRFHDVDTKKQTLRRFQMILDPFMLSQAAPYILAGGIDDIWGRTGQGTARITTRFSGMPLGPKGWTRSNMFFSQADIVGEMLKEFTQISQLIALNPFQEIRPLGIDIEVQVSSEPRLLLIQKIELDKKEVYRPGDTIEGNIILRGWRKQPFSKKFSLTVPEKMTGIAELVVRGGGIEENVPDSLSMGWRAICSLKELLGEMDARETNDQIIIEIRGQEELPEKGKKQPTPEDVMSNKLQAQLREEKMQEGSLRILRTNYYINGLLRELIQIGDPDDTGSRVPGDAGRKQAEEDVKAIKDGNPNTSDGAAVDSKSVFSDSERGQKWGYLLKKMIQREPQ